MYVRRGTNPQPDGPEPREQNNEKELMKMRKQEVRVNNNMEVKRAAWVEAFGYEPEAWQLEEADLYEGTTVEEMKAAFTNEEAQNWECYTQTAHGVLFAL